MDGKRDDEKFTRNYRHEGLYYHRINALSFVGMAEFCRWAAKKLMV